MHALLCLYKQQEMTTKISQVQEHPLNSSRSTSTRFFCIPARRSSPELQLLSYLLLIMATSVTTRSPSTTLLTLGPVLFGAKEGLIDYLKEKKLLNNYTTCNGCGLPMQWKKKGDIKDGYTWRCYSCDMRQSIRLGSFFSKSKLELSLYLNVIYHWAIDQPVHTTATQLKLSQKTVIDLFHFLREVCSKKLCDKCCQVTWMRRCGEIDLAKKPMITSY